MNNRQSWEIAYCTRICFAQSYVRYLIIEGHERITLQSAYRCDDLRRWAKDNIIKILARAERERGGRPLSAAAQSVVAKAAGELRTAIGVNPVCGHPLDSIASSDEGTCYCKECEGKAN